VKRRARKGGECVERCERVLAALLLARPVTTSFSRAAIFWGVYLACTESEDTRFLPLAMQISRVYSKETRQQFLVSFFCSFQSIPTPIHPIVCK
jgi:hypothetical protein